VATGGLKRMDAEAASARELPSLDRLLNAAPVAPLVERHGRSRVVAALRDELDRLRARALAGELAREELDADAIARVVDKQLTEAAQPRLRALFNLTGTVLHTNLGRALLPDAAVRAIARAAAAPVNLEFDLDTGGRGDRRGRPYRDRTRD